MIVLIILYVVALPTASWEPVRRLTLRLVLIAAYPALVALTRAYTLRDAAEILGQFRRQ
ncbi:MAG: hypothetical protein HKN17_08640 [Rhodothermales bacterium]|nr:hypothetical protein [Rhodothermales bacterium]